MTPTDAPQISVVIATRNRSELLRRCLGSLATQSEPPDRFEVIVASDGSEDGTEVMAEGLRTPFALRVLRLPGRGKSAALNAGIGLARGHACLFLDDDIVAQPGLVSGHRGAQEPTGALGIGAIVEQPPLRSDWYAQAFARGWAEHNLELLTRPPQWTDCYGANFSAPRNALLAIGGFSPELDVAEDFDIAYRLWKAGCEPVYLPTAAGVHDDQKQSARMLEDARRQGETHVALALRFPEARPELLDWHAGAATPELALRRACLTLRIPPAGLAWLGRFLPGRGRKMIWLHFVRRLAFWRGAMQAQASGGAAGGDEALTA